jgi:hypothetical protein
MVTTVIVERAKMTLVMPYPFEIPDSSKRKPRGQLLERKLKSGGGAIART